MEMQSKLPTEGNFNESNSTTRSVQPSAGQDALTSTQEEVERSQTYSPTKSSNEPLLPSQERAFKPLDQEKQFSPHDQENPGDSEEYSSGEVASEAGWRDELVGRVLLFGEPIISLLVEGQERLCLAQISMSLLHEFSYNEIHNRRVALGITCLQCTPSQLEVLRRAGAMPVTSRRCGLITKREAERLVRSFIADVPPPRLPENFTFRVRHQCGWGNEGIFVPLRYNSSRAKCIKCVVCDAYFSPNKFIFHCHPSASNNYRHPDAANFNSWRRHLELVNAGKDERLMHAWEDVKAMFNGGCRKRFFLSPGASSTFSSSPSSPSLLSNGVRRGCSVSPFGDVYENEMALNKTNTLSLTQSHCLSNHRNSINVPNSLKSASVPESHEAVPQASFTSANGTLSLISPAVLSNTHSAFFTSGFHGQMMSYGDYLRCMSRPYNYASSMPVAGQNLLSDPFSIKPPYLFPSILGDSNQPFKYTGYPNFGLPIPIPDNKGNESHPFKTHLSPCRGFYPSMKRIRGRNIGNEQRIIFHSEMSATEALVDKCSVNEAKSRDETIKKQPSKEAKTSENDASRSLLENVSAAGKDCKITEKNREGNEDEKLGAENVHLSGQEEELKQQFDCGSSHNLEEKIVCKKTLVAENLDSTVSGDAQNQEHIQSTLILPTDTKSLLKMLETAKSMDVFLHLPIETLRRLHQASRKKSQTADRELRKIKDMQRLQRLRAEELREELSRQFFAIKENIWIEIEQERKVRNALQEKLTEAQKLVPETLDSAFSLFPDRK